MSTPMASGGPTIIDTPLPPGITSMAQFFELEGGIVTIAINAAVVFAIIVWDYLSTLPSEIMLYRQGNGMFRSPVTWAFIVLRYSGIVATFPSLFFTSIQSDHCLVAMVISQMGVVFAVASSGFIFFYRVCAIYGWHKLVVGVVLLLYMNMVALWITVASQYRIANGPTTPFGSNCQLLPIAAWAPICYASSVLFDLCVVLLTTFKLKSMGFSRVAGLLYRDSLFYFVLTAAANISVLVIQALPSSSFQLSLIKPAVLPYSTLMTVAMGSRVFMNLRMLHMNQSGGSGIRFVPSDKSQGTSPKFQFNKGDGKTLVESIASGKPGFSDTIGDPVTSSFTMDDIRTKGEPQSPTGPYGVTYPSNPSHQSPKEGMNPTSRSVAHTVQITRETEYSYGSQNSV